MKAELRE